MDYATVMKYLEVRKCTVKKENILPICLFWEIVMTSFLTLFSKPNQFLSLDILRAHISTPPIFLKDAEITIYKETRFQVSVVFMVLTL